MTGCGIFRMDQSIPARIPRMMGLVRTFLVVFQKSALGACTVLSLGAVRDKIMTAMMLYSGTVPTIIKAAMVAVP